ncbi:hypothetical protein [Amycolatopsis nigrescens]|uniref:hypothetical protein n=1 Tax=Amycolatopsis nigrescens TaxID=381445 RepID=UPI0003698636|nr:hypothetical protein [Amycolatopsis nigrescens]
MAELNSELNAEAIPASAPGVAEAQAELAAIARTAATITGRLDRLRGQPPAGLTDPELVAIVRCELDQAAAAAEDLRIASTELAGRLAVRLPGDGR